MRSGIPAGLYLPGKSVLHRLNPCAKLLALFLLLAAVVLTDRIVGYLLIAAFAALLIALSGLPVRVVFASVGRLSAFFVLILLMNTCFYAPEEPWFRFWIFCPSAEGLAQGIHVSVRVAFLLLFGNLLTATTPPIAMTAALARLLTPLRLLRLPTGQIAMILSVAIQFVPTLLEETDTIRKAQTARGARFDSPKLTEQAAAMPPLAVPIFLAAFRRADELSLAMEARGCRPNADGPGMKTDPLAGRDHAALLLCLLLLLIQIFVF